MSPMVLARHRLAQNRWKSTTQQAFCEYLLQLLALSAVCLLPRQTG